eukprot:2106101-Amphidinium_carterae.1
MMKVELIELHPMMKANSFSISDWGCISFEDIRPQEAHSLATAESILRFVKPLCKSQSGCPLTHRADLKG